MLARGYVGGGVGLQDADAVLPADLCVHQAVLISSNTPRSSSCICVYFSVDIEYVDLGGAELNLG